MDQINLAPPFYKTGVSQRRAYTIGKQVRRNLVPVYRNIPTEECLNLPNGARQCGNRVFLSNGEEVREVPKTGNRCAVLNYNAYETGGGLKADEIVEKKNCAVSRKQLARIGVPTLWGNAIRQARAEQGLEGMQTLKGELLARAREIHEELKAQAGEVQPNVPSPPPAQEFDDYLPTPPLSRGSTPRDDEPEPFYLPSPPSSRGSTPSSRGRGSAPVQKRRSASSSRDFAPSFENLSPPSLFSSPPEFHDFDADIGSILNPSPVQRGNASWLSTAALEGQGPSSRRSSASSKRSSAASQASSRRSSAASQAPASRRSSAAPSRRSSAASQALSPALLQGQAPSPASRRSSAGSAPRTCKTIFDKLLREFIEALQRREALKYFGIQAENNFKKDAKLERDLGQFRYYETIDSPRKFEEELRRVSSLVRETKSGIKRFLSSTSADEDSREGFFQTKTGIKRHFRDWKARVENTTACEATATKLANEVILQFNQLAALRYLKLKAEHNFPPRDYRVKQILDRFEALVKRFSFQALKGVALDREIESRAAIHTQLKEALSKHATASRNQRPLSDVNASEHILKTDLGELDFKKIKKGKK